MHTYNLIGAKIFMEARKWNKEKTDIITWNVLESLFGVFLCVSFPLKVSHLKVFFFFLAYKKVDYQTKCFLSTSHLISTRTKKQFATLFNDR